MKQILLSIFSFLAFSSFSQFDLGGMVKDKANEAKDKTKKAVREKTTEHWEKKRQEYDESNFNYAISFLDNTGLFESSEKGNGFSSTLLSGAKFANNEEKSIEDRAYTNLKNGEILMASNKFALAEQSFKLAKALYETDNKKNTLNYAQTISNLGLLYQSRGRYNKAKPYNEEAITLRESLDNKGMLAVSYNNMGVLKKENGVYVEAESFFKKAQGIVTELNDGLGVALVKNNLAMTYLEMNKLNDAETLMKSSIDEAGKVMKDNSSNFIKLQINLANIYRFQKKYPQAEELFLNAIKVKEKKMGAHPDLAHLKSGLAQLYMDMNKTAEVEKLLQSAYDINKRKLGDNNPATVSSQQELGNFHRYSRNENKAIDLLQKVVDKKKTIYGEDHPNYIQALEDLAIAQSQNNNIAAAKPNYLKVMESTQKYITTYFNTLNDNEKTLYWDKTANRLQRFYSFVCSNADNSQDLIVPFYNTAINTKGFLLNNSSKIRNIISESEDISLKDSYKQWLETKENLNSAYQLSKEELYEEHVNIDSLQKRADELERELSSKSSEFKEAGEVQTIKSENIQALVAPNEAVVEIVLVNDYLNGFTGKQTFKALVVKSTGVQLINMGDADVIQTAVKAFRGKTIDRKPENEAYAATWKNLDAALTGVTKLYLALDGIYHQLSINALKDETGKYILDKYSIQFVGNTKDVISVKKSEAAPTKPKNALLIGNPFYGKNEMIAQLPGTEAEVKNIKKTLTLYKVQNEALFGAQATEEKVKKTKSPSILHIATHGYFLPDVSNMEATKVLGVDINAAKQNPLLRSGVLLANCDNVFDENYHAGDADNGVLTAYEAMSMNLSKTDLVVLSACETGLGSVKQGEGVFGLQRAFLIAGAKSIIMSLWSVSDAATMELMTLFYTNYSKTGNKQQAFIDAQKQLKVKYKDPFFWSAFVMLSK
jgi:CHAT domain-containing protein